VEKRLTVKVLYIWKFEVYNIMNTVNEFYPMCLYVFDTSLCQQQSTYLSLDMPSTSYLQIQLCGISQTSLMLLLHLSSYRPFYWSIYII